MDEVKVTDAELEKMVDNILLKEDRIRSSKPLATRKRLIFDALKQVRDCVMQCNCPARGQPGEMCLLCKKLNEAEARWNKPSVQLPSDEEIIDQARVPKDDEKLSSEYSEGFRFGAYWLRSQIKTVSPAKHEWHKFRDNDYESCKICQIVRRADDKNSPCKGKPKITMREVQPISDEELQKISVKHCIDIGAGTTVTEVLRNGTWQLVSAGYRAAEARILGRTK